ncbi:MAG: PAS domain S-box protein [Desulfobacterales bacterium]|nr:PAS domain S-box protein [Desulfobacterales bacterium]
MSKKKLPQKSGKGNDEYPIHTEADLTDVLNSSPVLMMVVDQDRRIVKVSYTLSRLTGRSPDTHKGLRPGEAMGCIHRREDPKGCGFGEGCTFCRLAHTVNETFNTGEACFRKPAEISLTDDTHPRRHLRVTTSLTGKSENQVLVFIEDVTEQSTAEMALREQNLFLNALVDTISNPIFYKDIQGRYTGCNKAFETFTGKPKSQIIGKTVFDMGPEEIAEKYFKKDAELFQHPGQQRYEWKLQRSDGKMRDVIFDKATLHDTEGQVTGLVGVVSDITERKLAEDLVRNHSQMLLQAQERERQMISCELHDSIAQDMSALKLYIRHLGHTPEAADTCKKMAALLDHTIEAVRGMAYNLRPAILDHLGVVHALRTYCEEFSEQTGIQVIFRTAGVHESGLNPELQINLYRLVLEGFANIRKHSGASDAVVSLVGAHPILILRIRDNGSGFNPDETKRLLHREKRMGLRSMKERVRLLDGKMSIKSKADKGTEIIITLPQKNEKENGTEETNSDCG